MRQEHMLGCASAFRLTDCSGTHELKSCTGYACQPRLCMHGCQRGSRCSPPQHIIRFFAAAASIQPFSDRLAIPPMPPDRRICTPHPSPTCRMQLLLNPVLPLRVLGQQLQDRVHG